METRRSLYWHTFLFLFNISFIYYFQNKNAKYRLQGVRIFQSIIDSFHPGLNNNPVFFASTLRHTCWIVDLSINAVNCIRLKSNKRHKHGIVNNVFESKRITPMTAICIIYTHTVETYKSRQFATITNGLQRYPIGLRFCLMPQLLTNLNKT